MDTRAGPGYVYLLQRDDGWCKIGRTANPELRFRQWQTQAEINHYDLAPLLLAKVSDQYKAERLLHGLFDAKRMSFRWRGTGLRREWFKMDRTDLAEYLLVLQSISDALWFLGGTWSLPGEPVPTYSYPGGING